MVVALSDAELVSYFCFVIAQAVMLNLFQHRNNTEI
jgi:hypothetical protein